MDTQRKFVVGAAVTALVLVAIAALWAAKTYSTLVDPSSMRSFAVSASGETTAIPDIAKFSFSVITEGGETLDELQAENTESVNNAVSFLKEEGIEDKDIKTEQYMIHPRYTYFDCPRFQELAGTCPPPEITGYTVTQTTRVTVRDFIKIGSLLSGVVERGANSVSQLTFQIEDQTAVENEAREEAIEKAKEKAEAVADAGGFRLGRILSIQESAAPFPFFVREGLGMGGADGSVPVPQIEPGSQDVTVNVTVTYEIR